MELVHTKKAEPLKAWLAMVGRVRIWMCRCCERKTINRTEKGRNHAVSLFFSIFYDISNELRSTDFP